MDINNIILEIKRQFSSSENCTAYGEPQAWIYLDNGRSIEIVHEEDGLDEDEYYFSLRLHCTDEEYDGGYYHSTVGVISTYCSENVVNPLNVDCLSNDIEILLKINNSEPLKTA